MKSSFQYNQYRLVLWGVALVMLVLASPLRAQEKSMATDARVWSGLFYVGGEDASKGTVPDGCAARMVERMKMIDQLKFPTYRLLGQVNQDILKEYESWVLPSEVFFIKLDSLGCDENGALQATLQVWQQKNVLMKASVTMLPDRPMFVRGPKWGDGYIVIALLLK